MAFYEAHKAQRDRFEVLAFCCDFEERLKDIAGLEKELEPVKKAVWGGKALPSRSYWTILFRHTNGSGSTCI